MNRKEFNEQTSGKKFVAIFTKKDGSERKMLATTSFDFIPEEFRPKEKEMTEDEIKIRKELQETSPYVNVFDLEANGWRKLNLETLETLDLVKT